MSRYENTGHGHVWPRPDGAVARCGGPAICSQCAADLARESAPPAPVGYDCPDCGGHFTKSHRCGDYGQHVHVYFDLGHELSNLPDQEADRARLRLHRKSLTAEVCITDGQRWPCQLARQDAELVQLRAGLKAVADLLDDTSPVTFTATGKCGRAVADLNLYMALQPVQSLIAKP